MSSLVTNSTGNCKLGYDCRRVRSHRRRVGKCGPISMFHFLILIDELQKKQVSTVSPNSSMILFKLFLQIVYKCDGKRIIKIAPHLRKI